MTIDKEPSQVEFFRQGLLCLSAAGKISPALVTEALGRLPTTNEERFVEWELIDSLIVIVNVALKRHRPFTFFERLVIQGRQAFTPEKIQESTTETLDQVDRDLLFEIGTIAENRRAKVDQLWESGRFREAGDIANATLFKFNRRKGQAKGKGKSSQRSPSQRSRSLNKLESAQLVRLYIEAPADNGSNELRIIPYAEAPADESLKGQTRYVELMQLGALAYLFVKLGGEVCAVFGEPDLSLVPT